MVATRAMSSLPATPLTGPAISSTTRSTAASMPRLRPIGLAPAAALEALLHDRLGQQGGGGGAVADDVVGGGGHLAHQLAALVLEGVSTSISRAMVTPSLVMVGGAELVEHHVAPLEAPGSP